MLSYRIVITAFNKVAASTVLDLQGNASCFGGNDWFSLNLAVSNYTIDTYPSSELYLVDE